MNLTGGLKFVYFHTTLRKTHIVPAGPQREKIHRSTGGVCIHSLPETAFNMDGK